MRMSTPAATRLESLVPEDNDSLCLWILSKLTACPLRMASHSDSGKET
jgi:hypothetical protein